MRRRKHCIFCRASPVTKEHIFGKELAKAFPEVGEKIKPNFDKIMLLDGDGDSKITDGPAATRNQLLYSTYKCCCRHCNSTWMKYIQEQALSTIIEIVRKGRSVVSPAEARKIRDYGYLKAQIIMAESYDLTRFELSQGTEQNRKFHREMMAQAVMGTWNEFYNLKETPQNIESFIAIRGGFADESGLRLENPQHGFRFEPGHILLTGDGQARLIFFCAIHLPYLSIVSCGTVISEYFREALNKGYVFRLEHQTHDLNLATLKIGDRQNIEECGLLAIDNLNQLNGSNTKLPRY